MIHVLTDPEWELVVFVGKRRSEHARAKGRARLDGLPNAAGGGDEWNDIVSSAGEYVVAKLANRFWHALADDVRKTVLTADVGEDIHVKSITARGHNLIVKGDDPRFGVYVLCLVAGRTVEIVGAFPAELIHQGHWCETLPVPAYLIGQGELLSPREAFEFRRRLKASAA